MTQNTVAELRDELEKEAGRKRHAFKNFNNFNQEINSSKFSLALRKQLEKQQLDSEASVQKL